MKPLDRDIPVVYLRAGEIHITARPELVVTLLGSCLSITMFNRRTKLDLLASCPCAKDERSVSKVVGKHSSMWIAQFK
jgi:chemotaxis receptor (MCP) glutamine deamidase CheD